MVVNKNATFLFILMLVFIPCDLFSDEIAEYNDRTKSDIFLTLSLFTSPPDDLNLIFFHLGYGKGYGIIPNRWYIGAAGDVGIGMDYVLLFLDSQNDENNKRKRDYYQLGFSFGAKAFSLFRMPIFDLYAFFGCDLMYAVMPLPYFGMEIALTDLFGLEYMYYFQRFNNGSMTFRVSLKLHINDW
jgi:hypothetical protein